MKKILFVDDEPNVLAAFERQLYKRFPVQTAPGPEQGLDALKDAKNFSVVVADMRMPRMNGIQFLACVKEMAPDIVRVMLTGNADQQTAIEAINQGNVFRFLCKPCSQDDLIDTLNAALRQHQLIIAERELLEQTLFGSVKVLTDILSIIDPKTFAQAERLRQRVAQVAAVMKLKDVWALEAAAMLANIGRVTAPPEVILKARLGHPLSPRELEIFERLPNTGADLIAQIPRMDEIAKIIRYQDQRFDGGDAYNSVRGERIPFGARLLKVANDLMEMEEQCPHKTALTQLRSRTGWYDPAILNALSEIADHPAPPPLTPIAFKDLHVGHLLRSDVRTKDGILLVVSGNHITPALLERLKNFESLSGIQEPITVEDDSQKSAIG